LPSIPYSVSSRSPQHLWRTLSLGIKTIWLHKLRSFLTALGVVFGVASVVAMLAIGEGASHEAQEQIRKLGSQNIILQSVKPPDGQGSSGESRSMISEYGLTTRDIQQIRQTVPGISIVVPSRSHLRKHLEPRPQHRWPDHGRAAHLSRDAEPPDHPGALFHRSGDGRTRARLRDQSRRSPRGSFPLSTPTGKSVRVKGYYYKVIGIIQDEGQSVGTDAGSSGNAPAQIMIPFVHADGPVWRDLFPLPHRQL
jgi:putative ABC transport system permease protein